MPTSKKKPLLNSDFNKQIAAMKNPDRLCHLKKGIESLAKIRILVPFSGLFPGYAYYYLPLLAPLLYFFSALDSVVWCGLGPPDDVSSFLLGSSIIQHTQQHSVLHYCSMVFQHLLETIKKTGGAGANLSTFTLYLYFIAFQKEEPSMFQSSV